MTTPAGEGRVEVYFRTMDDAKAEVARLERVCDDYYARLQAVEAELPIVIEERDQWRADWRTTNDALVAAQAEARRLREENEHLRQLAPKPCPRCGWYIGHSRECFETWDHTKPMDQQIALAPAAPTKKDQR